VWKRAQARAIATGNPAARAEARSRADLRLSALGSGSDYSAFLQHAGIPTLNLGFGGQSQSDGVYHSIYDDFYYYSTFIDPDFAYGRALSQTVGTMVVRMADADLLPFEFTSLADTVQTYVRELQTLLRTQQDDVRERNRQIEDGVFTAMNNPARPIKPPVVEVVAPAINFAPLENAAAALSTAAERYRKAAEAARGKLTADATVRVSRDRLRSAIRNSGFDFPHHRITVNLAPADVRKAGSSFDLPIALGLLAVSGPVTRRAVTDTVVVGELSLDGGINGIRGVLPIAIAVIRGVRSPLFVVSVGVAAFVFWTHRANIGRLRRGEEPRFGRKQPPEQPPQQ
jgi:hypothetical protein